MADEKNIGTGGGGGTPPKFKIRDGEVKVAVWENQSEDGKTFYNAELEIRRLDKDKNWVTEGPIRFPLRKALKISNMLSQVYSQLALKDDSKKD